MTKIKKVEAREILDSKGTPTVEVKVVLENGLTATAAVASGASTGSAEACELRDGDSTRYFGKGVLKAVKNINTEINDLLVDQEVTDQEKIDEMMIKLDPTPQKATLGANAVVGVSMAVCRAAALSLNLPLYKYFGQLSGNKKLKMPQPQILVLEGGKHGNWSTDCQEFMVLPKLEKFGNFSEMLRVGTEIFSALGKFLNEKGYSVGVGFEGAYMPREIKGNEEALELIVEAIKAAGFKPGEEVVLGIDGAASEWFKDGKYRDLSPEEWTEKIIRWTKKYPIWSLEDMYEEESWQDWTDLTAKVGNWLQVIGDDLLTTNVERIKKAIKLKACNSVLIKLNQIGTVTETLEAIRLAIDNKMATIVSHRGGETNDDMIADLVVGAGCEQSKFGAPCRGERIAKYNRLLEIEREI
ncbi:MAG: phosphopyruvate hydratase [Candidatus Beckwithbacteria bacterium]|nr:phosphopyruvate hydratase [Candidatus Beckwithbacteria bacterium]